MTERGAERTAARRFSLAVGTTETPVGKRKAGRDVLWSVQTFERKVDGSGVDPTSVDWRYQSSERVSRNSC